MARIRTIKPEFPQSESMGRVSRDARLLFIMLWTLVDDHGRTRANPTLLANLLFPYDDDAKLRIPEWLMELERQKCVRVYAVDDNTYLQIEKWSEHQRIDHPGKSKFPSPPESLGGPRKKIRGSRKNTPRTKEGIKDQGEDQGGDAKPHVAVAPFDDFWKACPKKVGRGKAEEKFAKVVSEGVTPETLIAAMIVYAQAQAGKDPTYTAHPATWLHQKRWLDEGEAAPASTGADMLARLEEAERLEAEHQRNKLKGPEHVH